MKISLYQILLFCAVGFIAQSFFVAGSLYENGFYNRYLGFSILLPFYAISMTYIVNRFSLKHKIIILPLSMFLLSILGFINFALYPIMGGSVAQMYGIIFAYGIFPAALIIGALYGLYITYKIKNNDVEIQKKDEKNHKSIPNILKSNKQLIIIWIIGLIIIIITFFSYLEYNNLLILILGFIIGSGIIMRIKWARWILLIGLYFEMLRLLYYLISDFFTIPHLDNYAFFGMSLNLFSSTIVIWLLSNKESFKEFSLDYSNRKKEIITIVAVTIIIMLVFYLAKNL